MSVTVDQAFITQYESEVKLAYQQMGSKLRNVVRTKTAVTGSVVTFQKLGKGAASQKSRHGDVPVMNAVHSNASATLSDWYAADYVDKLDELKTNIDERQVTVQTGAYGLGRKADNLIITAVTASLGAAYQNQTAYGGYGSSVYNNAIEAAVLQGFEALNSNDVPDDGLRVCLVGSHQWNHLLKVTEFASSDYVGAAQHPWLAGTQARKWLNTLFMMHTGLATANSGASRICLMFHKTALGLGEGQAITTTIDWVPQKAAHLIDNMLSAGAVRIEDEGVWAFYAQDAAMT